MTDGREQGCFDEGFAQPQCQAQCPADAKAPTVSGAEAMELLEATEDDDASMIRLPCLKS